MGVRPRENLNPAKPNPKNKLSVNQDNAVKLDREEKNSVTDPESVSSVHVNDKMKNVAQDFFNNKQTKSEKKPLPVRKLSEPIIEVVKPSGRKMSDSTFE